MTAIRPAAMLRLLPVAMALALFPMRPAAAGSWLGAAPAEEPEPIIRRAAPPMIAVAEPGGPAAITRMAQAALQAGYDSASSLLGHARGVMASVASATGEAAWEASYALGINATPAPRPVLADPIPAPRHQDEALAPREAAQSGPAQDQAPVLPAPSIAPIPLDPAPREADAGLIANLLYDPAQRRPDGTFFVPKPLQRLFAVRTVAVFARDVPVTLALAGRIVADPHCHSHVEASVLGRIAAPETGLPVLGDVVAKDQVLGFVAPAVSVVDRTAMRREVARLTTAIRVETENTERLRQFVFVPFRDGKIYQSQIRADGLRRERAAMLQMLDTREVLRAPTDGVISIAAAVEGGIVNPGQTIFDIVDPTRLWIEAVAPDETAALDATSIAAASAATPEGAMLRLSYIGSGLALRQQQTPILFRIDQPPPGLRLDRPVTITIQGRRTQRGFVLPKAAVTTDSDGVQEAWEQTGPESFTPHPVRARALDDDTVLVMDGLRDGARIVSSGGMQLMAQLQ